MPGDHRMVADFGQDGQTNVYLARLVGASQLPGGKPLYVLVRQSQLGHGVVLSRVTAARLGSVHRGISDELVDLWRDGARALGVETVEQGRTEWEGRSVGDVWVHMRHYPDRGLVVLHLVDESTRKTHTYNMTTAIARSMRDWLNARLPAVPATAPDARG